VTGHVPPAAGSAWPVPSAAHAGPVAPREPLCLVLDGESHPGQRGRVLPVVMRAKQQVLPAEEEDTDAGLGAAAVAAMQGVHRLGGCQRSAGHRLRALPALSLALGP
jgi:hypothetical protein